MNDRRRALLMAALLVGTAPLAGCGGAQEDAQEASTQTEEAMDGLSPEELRRQVEVMSPAKAESLGTQVDTTITVGSPVRSDSVPQAPARPDTVQGAGQ